MVEKSYSDGKLEYGKLSLVGNVAQASPLLCPIAQVQLTCPVAFCHSIATVHPDRALTILGGVSILKLPANVLPLSPQ